MKNRSFLFSILFLLFPLLCVRPHDSFEDAVDFSLDLKSISRLVRDPNFSTASISRAVIFDGSISALTILEPEPNDFLAELEIIGGEWLGTEALSLYRVYVYLQGPDFAPRVPLKSNSPRHEDRIELNRHALVVGDIVDVYEDEDGDRFAVILARHLRIIP